MKPSEKSEIIAAIKETYSQPISDKSEEIEYVLNQLRVLKDEVKDLQSSFTQIRSVLITYDKHKHPKASTTTRSMKKCGDLNKILKVMGLSGE